MYMGSAVLTSSKESNMAQQINPAWKQYNDINNEGGEGYNPHPKFVGQRLFAEELTCTTPPMGTWPGRAISRAEAESLLDDELRGLRDAEARAACGDLSAAVSVDRIKGRVAHYQSQLA